MILIGESMARRLLVIESLLSYGEAVPTQQLGGWIGCAFHLSFAFGKNDRAFSRSQREPQDEFHSGVLPGVELKSVSGYL